MNMTTTQIVQFIPIAISVLALAISCVSLGWNIYRDVALRARLRVHFALVDIFHPNIKKPINTLNLEITNLGPGKVILGMIQLKTAPLWRRITRSTLHAVMMHDYENPLSGKLPATLEVGERHNLLISYDKDCFLKEKRTHIGISDTFGRVHWSQPRQVRKARRSFKGDFREKRNGTTE